MSVLRPEPSVGERDARRRRRELDRQEIQFESAPEHKRAIYEVERYENYVAVLRSVHEECTPAVDWDAMVHAPEPPEPERLSTHEDEAREALDRYAPGWLDELLGRAARTVARLRADVDSGKRTDDWAYQQALERRALDLEEWRARRGLAERVSKGDEAAYREAIADAAPFQEIQELGSCVEVGAGLRVEIDVNADAVVPAEAKSLASDGRLTLRALLPEQRERIRLAYACSCVLRVAAEILALLPVDAVEITASDGSDPPLVVVRIPRGGFERLDLSQVDCVRQVTSGGW